MGLIIMGGEMKGGKALFWVLVVMFAFPGIIY